MPKDGKQYDRSAEDLGNIVGLEHVNLQVEEIRHGGALPRLPDFYVNMYLTQGPRRRLAEPLAKAFRGAYAEHRLMMAAE